MDGAGPLLQFDVQLDRRDMKAAARGLRLRREGRSVNFWTNVHLGSSVVAILALFNWGLRSGVAYEAAAVGLTAVFLASASIRQSKLSRYVEAYGRWHVAVYEEGVTFTNLQGVSTWRPWGSFLDITATADHILGLCDPMTMVVWPRRCMAPGDDERLFQLGVTGLRSQHPGRLAKP